MESLPLILVAIVAPLGAIDVLYFHIYKFRLHARAASWAETLTHIVRSALIGLFALLVANADPQGAWFWVGGLLIVGDVVNNLIDVLLEPAARAELGGLPPAEYAIHMIGGSMSGAIALAYFLLLWSNAAMPTALAASPHPAWLVLNGNLIAVGSFLIGGAEAALMARAMLRARVGDRVAA